MKKTAVLILTYNEEKNIADCIKSAAFADEVVVVDSASTDKTCEIAKQLGAKVCVHPMNGFAEQRNFALEQTEADWVFYLDADERLTPQAAEEIQRLTTEEPSAYEIKRINIIFGQMMRHGEHAPDYSLRLYPRQAIRWEGKIHEQAIVSLPIKKMKSVMHHHTYTDWNRYFIKFNQYTTLMAEKMHERGKKAYVSDLVFRPWYAFFRFYILKFGFLDGKMGLVFAIFHGFYTFSKYVKLYYWQGNQVVK